MVGVVGSSPIAPTNKPLIDQRLAICKGVLGNIRVTFDVFYPLKNCLDLLLFESISPLRISAYSGSLHPFVRSMGVSVVRRKAIGFLPNLSGRARPDTDIRLYATGGRYARAAGSQKQPHTGDPAWLWPRSIRKPGGHRDIALASHSGCCSRRLAQTQYLRAVLLPQKTR